MTGNSTCPQPINCCDYEEVCYRHLGEGHYLSIYVISAVITLVYVLVSAIAYLWRLVRINKSGMWRIMQFHERFFAMLFLSIMLLTEFMFVHAHHFVPNAVACPPDDVSVFSWITINVTALVMVVIAHLYRPYARALLYIPFVMQTTLSIVIMVIVVAHRQVCLSSLSMLLYMCVGMWTIMYIPKAFQLTEDLLYALDPSDPHDAMTLIEEAERKQAPISE